MKKKKYLPLYHKWMETGKMDSKNGTGISGGLCGSSARGRLLNRMRPTIPVTVWWGYGLVLTYDDIHEIQTKFTPLRQTIVLFLAAMNNEL